MIQTLKGINDLVKKNYTRVFGQENTVMRYKRTMSVFLPLAGVYMGSFVTVWFPLVDETFVEVVHETGSVLFFFQLIFYVFLFFLFYFVIPAIKPYPAEKIMRRMKNIYGAKRTEEILSSITDKQLLISPITILGGIIFCHWGIKCSIITFSVNPNDWYEVVHNFLLAYVYYVICNWFS